MHIRTSKIHTAFVGIFFFLSIVLYKQALNLITYLIDTTNDNVECNSNKKVIL